MSEQIMPAVGIDINMFWQILNFIILIFVFKIYFHKPLNNVLEKRRVKIADELTKAEKERKLAESLNSEAIDIKKASKLEAHKIIALSEAKAEERKEKIMKETHAAREKMITSAEAEIAKMREKASKELQVEATKLAVMLAEKMINEKMSRKLGANLLDQFIDEVGESK